MAEILFKELEKHPYTIQPSKEDFINKLVSVDVPESSRFYEKLPSLLFDKSQSGCDYILLLRRILRNKNAKQHQLKGLKKIGGNIIDLLGGYSSDDLTRRLRTNETIVSMMNKCEYDFSLLGKMLTYDGTDPRYEKVEITRPILLVPNAKDVDIILDWEEANRKIKAKVGIFHWKKIKPEEYYTLQ